MDEEIAKRIQHELMGTSSTTTTTSTHDNTSDSVLLEVWQEEEKRAFQIKKEHEDRDHELAKKIAEIEGGKVSCL